MKQIVKVLALTLTCALTAGVFGGCLIGGGKSQNAANGNLSSYGLVASSDKYTFIAQSSNDYSGDGNGSFSCTNIYRVSNKKQDDPVVIYSEPAAVRYGNPGGISVAFMTYAYGRLYFLTMQDTGMEIHWISDDGKKSGTVDLDLGRYLRRTPVSDGSGYYIYCPDADYTVTADSEDYSYVNAYCWYRVDMKTGKAAKFRPAFLEENELAMYITSADGYLYFIKGYPDTETMDKGIYRAKSGDKRAEGIVEADPDLLEDVDFMLACGNDLWFMGNHELHYVDISTGKDTLLGDDLRESPLNTSGDGLVWHSDYDGRIVRTDKEGHTEVVYSADPDKEAVFFSGGYVYIYSEDYTVFAAEKDARITPSKPMIAGTEITYETSGDWSYRTNGKYARIESYTGTDAEVVIPKEIDGKTVTMVGYINLPETAAKLTVPEGVYFVNEVRGVSVKEIELPSSLDVIGEGQNFTFRFCPLLEKVNLNAKMEHWDEILEAYETMYSGQGIDAAGEANTGYTLYCTDGRIVVNY